MQCTKLKCQVREVAFGMMLVGDVYVTAGAVAKYDKVIVITLPALLIITYSYIAFLVD